MTFLAKSRIKDQSLLIFVCLVYFVSDINQYKLAPSVNEKKNRINVSGLLCESC